MWIEHSKCIVRSKLFSTLAKLYSAGLLSCIQSELAASSVYLKQPPHYIYLMSRNEKGTTSHQIPPASFVLTFLIKTLKKNRFINFHVYSVRKQFCVKRWMNKEKWLRLLKDLFIKQFLVMSNEGCDFYLAVKH